MSHLFCLNIFLQERFFFSFLEILPLPSTWLMLESWEPFLIPLVWACAFSCYLVWSFRFQIVQTLGSFFSVFSEMFWTEQPRSFPCLTCTGYSHRRTAIVHMASCCTQKKKCHASSVSVQSMPCKSIYWRKYSIETAPHFVLGMAYLPPWRCKAEYASLFFPFYMTSPLDPLDVNVPKVESFSDHPLFK